MELEQRVQRLERVNRWLWVALVVTVAMPLVNDVFPRTAVGVEPKDLKVHELQADFVKVGRWIECPNYFVNRQKSSESIGCFGADDEGRPFLELGGSDHERIELSIDAEKVAHVKLFNAGGAEKAITAIELRAPLQGRGELIIKPR